MSNLHHSQFHESFQASKLLVKFGNFHTYFYEGTFEVFFSKKA